MKTYRMWLEECKSIHLEEYKSLNQREVDTRLKKTPTNPQVFKGLSFKQMIVKMKDDYQPMKEVQITKGLLSNPTLLDNLEVETGKPPSQRPSTSEKTTRKGRKTRRPQRSKRPNPLG